MQNSSTALKDLTKLFLSIKSEPAMKALLSDILTPQEIISIAERLQIIKALCQGKTQRAIAAQLHTSIGKVTRGSRIVQFGKTTWNKMV